MRLCRMPGSEYLSGSCHKTLTQTWKISITRHLQEFHARNWHFSVISSFLMGESARSETFKLRYCLNTFEKKSPQYFSAPFQQPLRTISLTYCPLRQKLSPSVKSSSNERTLQVKRKKNITDYLSFSLSKRTVYFWYITFKNVLNFFDIVRKLFSPKVSA